MGGGLVRIQSSFRRHFGGQWFGARRRGVHQAGASSCIALLHAAHYGVAKGVEDLGRDDALDEGDVEERRVPAQGGVEPL